MHLPFLTLERISVLPALTQLPKAGDSVGSLLYSLVILPPGKSRKIYHSIYSQGWTLRTPAVLHCSLSPQTRTTEAELACAETKKNSLGIFILKGIYPPLRNIITREKGKGLKLLETLTPKSLQSHRLDWFSRKKRNCGRILIWATLLV